MLLLLPQEDRGKDLGMSGTQVPLPGSFVALSHGHSFRIENPPWGKLQIPNSSGKANSLHPRTSSGKQKIAGSLE